jgi:uncharacterized sulfatase
MTEKGPNGSDDTAQREIDRRRFLKSMGVVAAGGVLADLGLFDQMATATRASAKDANRRPNIIFLMVDELRFPSVFPDGISSREQFLQKFMPNLYELWRHGVKLENHHTAGMACSPARGSIVTGLYPHQQWLLVTRTAAGPSLQTTFPTYGKLLRQLGYHTPYIGKWHLSNPPSNGSTAGYLETYGFDGMTNPDPLGMNGEGQAKDPGIADQAISWLQNDSPTRQPYCLTVSFVNPHDRQFFWGGSEGTNYETLFASSSVRPFIVNYASVSGQDNPPPLGYPTLPPNWESGTDLQSHKPQAQTLFRVFQQLVWGAATDTAQGTGFVVASSPIETNKYGLGVAPFSYWERGLDMYTYVMTLVDAQIGRVVASVPKGQLANTVFVFVSDHGEYSGAHGFLAGKLGTSYDEAWHVPMVVADPSGRFTRHVDVPRQQLTSSVDLMPMLVSLGNGGSRSWMKGRLREIYGHRLDLVALLLNPRAAGRDHLVFATDEIVPVTLNYIHAPIHILGVQTHEAKLCTYSHWAPGTASPVLTGMELEFYDYATPAGRAEMLSTPNDPRAKRLAKQLFTRYVPQEMQAPLPPPLQSSSRRALQAYVRFGRIANAYSLSQLIDQQRIRDVLDFGLNM